MSAVTAESLFTSFFWPLYPPDAQADLAGARTTDANPAHNPAIVQHLDEAATIFTRMAPALFGADLALDRSDASVHRLGAAVTRARRDAWSAEGAPGTAESELFNVVVHGAAYLGACVVARHGGAWCARRPLWESLVRLESRAGDAQLAVFHWWLKSLADDAFEKGHTLADRYRVHVEVPCAKTDELPVIAPPDRKVPRLAKVSYATLYKHLRAHLPELRDLGADFPSPERFDQYGFASLDFALLGGGRTLLIHGAGEGGVHLFWIGAGGFEKSAHFPADKFPAYVLKVEAEKIVLISSVLGKNQVSEMLWWGP